MISSQTRRVIVDSDDEEEGDDELQKVYFKTPATKCANNPIISANSRTGEKEIGKNNRPSRGVTVAVRENEFSDDEMYMNGQMMTSVMHGENIGETRSESSKNKNNGRSCTYIVLDDSDAMEEIEDGVQNSVADDNIGRTKSDRTKNERRSCTYVVLDDSDAMEENEESVQNSTVGENIGDTKSESIKKKNDGRSCTHSILDNSDAMEEMEEDVQNSAVLRPPTPCVGITTPTTTNASSRRSARLAKHVSQEKSDLRRKLKDLRELRSKSKQNMSVLHDSSSGSEDLEIIAMAAKHQRDTRKRYKKRSSRLDQHDLEDSDDRVKRRFGDNHISEEEATHVDMDDMSNFIVDDDEIDDEQNYITKKSKNRPKSKSTRSLKSKRCKRRIQYISDNDDDDNLENVKSMNGANGTNGGKRHRMEPVLQSVSERKRKRRIIDSNDEDDDGENDIRICEHRNGMFVDDTHDLSEDSAAVDQRRQRKKGKVQRFSSGNVTQSNTLIPRKRRKLQSNRRIIRDDDDDTSSIYEASSESSDECYDSGTSTDDEEDGDDDDEGRDELLDGFSMYRQLDVMRQEQDDGDYDTAETPFFRKSFTVTEAVGIYIEMLLCILTDREYREKYNESISGALRVGVNITKGEQEHIQNHRSAARTVENLICTSRESLIGSSVWKGEFFTELTTRPFYDVSYTPNTNVASRTVLPDDRGKERGLERCDACGRENKCQDGYKLHLFGPSYDASGVWSPNRWLNHVPEYILNSVLPCVTAPLQPEPTSSSKPMASQVGSRCGSRRTSSSLTPGNRQQLAAAEIFKSDVKRMLRLQGREDNSKCGRGEEDGEEEGGAEEEGIDEGPTSMTSPSVALSSRLLKRVSISGNPVLSSGYSASESSSDGDSDSTQSNAAAIPWWQRKWGQDLDDEPESIWVVNSHCKRRTQLYHSLMHYKFRLLLKIRDRVRQKSLKSGPLSPIATPRRRGERKHVNEEESSGVSKSVNVRSILGGGFVQAETLRFENLLEAAGKKFGGEEHAKFSLWSDDDDELLIDKSDKRIRSGNSSSTSKQSGIRKSANGKVNSRSGSNSGSGNRVRQVGTLDEWIKSTPSSSSSNRS